MNNKKSIVIIGGGITGLSAAYYLQKEIERQGLAIELKLIEASGRLGGKIKTLKQAGYTIEQGPDSLLSRKPAAVELVKELGLQDEIIWNSTGKSYLIVDNEFHRLPQGTFMGIPKSEESLLSSTLISEEGKKRALEDLTIPKCKTDKDQSLGLFLRHRFGNELVDKQLSPLLAGIHSADIDKMSLLATYPNLLRLEQTYGSIIKGLQETIPAPKEDKGKKTEGIFFSFRDGLEALVHKLAAELADGTVILNNAIQMIKKNYQGYQLLLSGGELYQADAVIVATPHYTVSEMFKGYDFFQTLDEIPTTSTANVVMIFDKSAISNDIDGTGFQVPEVENYTITACTWTDKKWPTTAPDGKVMLRCYVGRASDQSFVNLTDEELTAIVLEDLKGIMGIESEPELTVITRWNKGRAQYNVGHLDRIASVRDRLKESLPGVYLSGSSYDGMGIPDCIDQGQQAATEVLEFLLGKKV
ncbi:protoporphyrinogen oxidase [Oceanobacillus chungangensis]|uniref:Coproporphyrinogen III oxidase n=1 Tax=Oceanobacillus chungangensis TaxID=1229152 RepID=A0A3D8PUX6_9BACI|nr:protoporphyrinogen oxidase [Oceanobacillus chungangensis]RDW19916.1 protoporphyrinogen oxidase [Oceanobacillus chungangensis]